MNNPAQKLAWLFAASFIGAFILGYIPNPLVGETALFMTNTPHNLVHLFTGIGFIIVAVISNRASTLFMKAFGFIYLGVAILGFVVLGSTPDGYLLGIIHFNSMDNFLHLGLSVAILSGGFFVNNFRGEAVAY